MTRDIEREAQYVREVSDVREQVEHRADPEPERTRDLERAHGVLHVVEHVVDVRPAGVGVQDLEGRSRVLSPERGLSMSCLDEE